MVALGASGQNGYFGEKSVDGHSPSAPAPDGLLSRGRDGSERFKSLSFYLDGSERSEPLSLGLDGSDRSEILSLGLGCSARSEPLSLVLDGSDRSESLSFARLSALRLSCAACSSALRCLLPGLLELPIENPLS